MVRKSLAEDFEPNAIRAVCWGNPNRVIYRNTLILRDSKLLEPLELRSISG
jgi:hypothetical protein